MTASVAGKSVGNSPTHISIERDLPELLAWRERLLQHAPDAQSGHLAAIAHASIDAEIALWLARRVPQRLLEEAARTSVPAEMTQYTPDVVSHPSETIRETLAALDKDWRSLHIEGGMMKRHAQYLVRGDAHITSSVALALETTTGVPAHFWLNRQAQYDAWRKGVD